MWRSLLALAAVCAVARGGKDDSTFSEPPAATSALFNHLVVDRNTTHGLDYVATNLTFFDCNTYSSCTQCASSSFSCDWCIDGNRCTHDTAENCRNDILVTGVGRTGPSYRSGPGFCPRINSTSDGSNEILVPYGVKKAIKVKVRVTSQFIVQTRFVCQFNIEGRVMQVNAQLLADTVYCDAMEFTYTSRAPNMTASFAVVWGGSKPLDNPDNVHLLIYRCSDMADNCGLCLSLSEKFGCGWCQGSDRCEVQGQCGAPSVWLDRRQICPETEVHTLNPQLDPLDDITNIKNETIKQDTCSSYKSCTQCVSSSFPCDWCLDSRRCTNDTAESCRNDILVTGIGRTGPSYRSGPGFCPRINSTFDGTNEILVPSGTKKAVKVKVRVIGQFIVQTRFVCQFNIEGRVMHVNAQLLADTVYCDAMEFTYTSRAPNMTASFAIIWGGSKPLDNPDNIHLLIYRCSNMADNCGLCLSLSEKFGCGWCQGSDRCEVQGQCGAPSVWLDRRQICPNTEVHTLNPQLDPSDGFTNITNETIKQDTCSSYKSCTQCVSSSFSCDWCLDSHRCTNDTAESCRNDILVTGVSRTGPSYRSGPGFCPRINSTFDGTNEILVPSGTKKAVKVKVRVIGQFIVQTRFVCQFNIEGRVMHVNAQLLADTVYCDAMEFTYDSRAPNVTASFAVIWGGSKPLDNPDNIHLLIYRCSDMADNCGFCLSLPEKFGCGWCQGSDRCEVQGQCGAPSVWLDRKQICPKTEVHTSNPQLDTSDGITNITNETIKQDTCSSYKSCTQCVSSSFPCDWCLDSHRCTNDTAESCRNDILVTGVGRTGPSYRSGPGFCPRINSTFDGTNEILVPSGTKKAVKVKVRVIGQFIVQTRFVCQFNIEGRVMQVNAQLLADTVYCDAMEFTYTSRAPNMTASFAIIWGGSKPLDNPDNIHLLIYRCSDMADNCGLCLSLPEKFGCGWCQGSDRCEVQGQCGAPSVWLDRRQICPITEVHTLNPQLDPSDGFTNITNETIKQDTCSSYKSCTQCVSSSFPCDWCLDSHRCTNDTAESCRNDILVTGVGRTGPSYRSGPGFCPRINSTFDGTNEILVPYGVKKAIKVKVRVISQFIVQTRFVCQFNIEGRVMQVNAQLLADTVYCDAMEFTYDSRAPNVTASFAVIWGGSKPLDNPDNIHLLIYRCSDMADNCGLCLSLPEKFGCGWCQGSDRCEVQGQCGAPSVWLDRKQICLKTEVHTSNPQLDTSDGITNITNETIKQDTCSSYKSCTQCVSSSFPCDWCLDSHRCTNDTAESCRNDILVTGVGRTGSSYRSGPGFCPRINSTFDGTNEILVPSGTKKAVKVKVRVIGQFIVQTRFLCQFNIEGRVMQVNAQLLADTVYCDAMEFTYDSRAPNVTASFAVIWGGSKPLDNPDNIHLLIYRCSNMANNCRVCSALPEIFGCGWCQGSDRCEVQGQCDAPSVWLDRRQICPKTEVHTLNPQLDPSDGITNITNETIKQDTCNSYKSCTQCVSSSFSCDWCLDSHRCTNDTVESCRNDILVTGVGRTGPSYRSGPGFCPRINSTSDGSNEIIVPYGVKQAIKVKVRVIGQFIVQTRFVCQFNIEGRVTQVNAQLLADTVYCDAMEFTYTSRAPNMTASFAVVWGGSKPLDNPDNVHLLIYRCSDMADNCGLCLSLSEKFGCGWCRGSDRCEVQGQCGTPSVWLDRRQICPNAEVQSSFP